MNLTVLQRCCDRLSSRVLTLALISIAVWGSASAKDITNKPLTLAKDTPTNTTDPIRQRLIGRWQTVRPPVAEIDSTTFAFAPDGKLLILMAGASGEKAVVQMDYVIDSKPQPMHLDLAHADSPDERVRTIFAFTDEGLLRLQISGTHPAAPRPTDFSPDDPPLKKVSNLPTFRPDPKEIQRQITGKKKEAEGKVYMNSLIQAELAHFIENGKYASAINQLGSGFQPETSNYRYEIVSEGNTQWIGVRAVAKRLGLKSFVGAVLTATEKDGPLTLMATVCQTKEPTRLPPRLPDLVTTETGEDSRIRCSEGTQPVR